MRIWSSWSIGVLERAVAAQNQLTRMKMNMATRCGRNRSRARCSLGLFVLTTIFVWVVTGCNGENTIQSPGFDGPNVDSPTPLNSGEEIGISLTVSRAAGVTLSYVWKVDLGGGEILRGQGSPAITYRAPDVPGTYKIGVEVSWDGRSEERAIFIEVGTEDVEVEVERETIPTLTSTSPSTDTLTPTPTATPTSMPSGTTQSRVTIEAPVLIEPAESATALWGPPTLRWQSEALPAGYSFVVRLHHADSGHVITSPELNTNHWRPELPAKEFGWWSWQVQVVKDGAQDPVATSDERKFCFKPTGSGSGTSPLPTPSD